MYGYRAKGGQRHAKQGSEQGEEWSEAERAAEERVSVTSLLLPLPRCAKWRRRAENGRRYDVVRVGWRGELQPRLHSFHRQLLSWLGPLTNRCVPASAAPSVCVGTRPSLAPPPLAVLSRALVLRPRLCACLAAYL